MLQVTKEFIILVLWCNESFFRTFVVLVLLVLIDKEVPVDLSFCLNGLLS